MKLKYHQEIVEEIPLRVSPLCPELVKSVLSRGKHALSDHTAITHHGYRTFFGCLKKRMPSLWLARLHGVFKQKTMTTDTDSGSSLQQHVSNGCENPGSAQG